MPPAGARTSILNPGVQPGRFLLPRPAPSILRRLLLDTERRASVPPFAERLSLPGAVFVLVRLCPGASRPSDFYGLLGCGGVRVGLESNWHPLESHLPQEQSLQSFCQQGRLRDTGVPMSQRSPPDLAKHECRCCCAGVGRCGQHLPSPEFKQRRSPFIVWEALINQLKCPEETVRNTAHGGGLVRTQDEGRAVILQDTHHQEQSVGGKESVKVGVASDGNPGRVTGNQRSSAAGDAVAESRTELHSDAGQNAHPVGDELGYGLRRFTSS